VYAPVVEYNYWTVNVSDVRVVGKNEDDLENRRKREPLCPGGCKTILDTGT